MKNIIIESNNKFYFKITEPNWLNQGYGEKALIDGKEPVQTWLPSWFVSDKRPAQLTMVTKKREYTGWTIKTEYTHLNLPAIVDSFEYDDDENMPAESMFYTRNFIDKEQIETKDIEFDTELNGDIEESVEFIGCDKSGWSSTTIVKIKPIASLTQSIIYPDILLPSKACALDGDQMFKIIRHHVAENIDHRYAEITSNYDFCFTVKKLLAITPETHTYDAKTSRQKTPRYKSYTITNREVEVFEMTSPSEKYGSYTVMGGLVGTSHSDLKSKLDKMLNDLMTIINEPLATCKHCDGTGVVSPEKVKING